MKTIIVEDNRLLRENIEVLLKGDSRIEFVRAFATAEETLGELEELPCEIMLMDLGLPGMSGIELIREVKKINPDIEIMVHTVFEDRDNIFSAIKAGASGYLLKGTSPSKMIDALYELYNGGAPMTPKIAKIVIREFHETTNIDEYLLTPREKQILKGIEKGLTYKELAQKYNISHHTVHSHIKNIYGKLQSKNRRDALYQARKKGIL
jgi:two-component system NarL family response regulator